MANAEKGVTRAPKSFTSDVEGRVVSYTDSVHVLDPNSPEAVQTPEGVDISVASGHNGLSVHEEPSPNEVAEQEARKSDSKPSKSDK